MKKGMKSRKEMMMKEFYASKGVPMMMAKPMKAALMSKEAMKKGPYMSKAGMKRLKNAL